MEKKRNEPQAPHTDEKMSAQAGLRFSSAAQVQAALKQKRDLSNADLSDLDIAGLKFTGLNAPAIVFKNANIPGGIIMAANMEGADFSNAFLDGAVIGATNLGGATFRGASLHGAKFHMCNLGGVDFRGANLTGTLWLASNVSAADFSETQMNGAKSSAVAWQTAKTPPAETPRALISAPRWAPFAALGMLGSLAALLFFYRRRSSE